MDPVNYVYVIGREDGPIKVGITTSIISRFNSIQTGCSFPIKLLYVMPCDDRDHARQHEATFHHVHDDKRLSGEWFQMTAEEAIDEVHTQFDFEAWDEHTKRWRNRA